MKSVRVLIVLAALAACSPANNEETAAPAAPPETLALTALSGNATEETGDLQIATGAGSLSATPSLRITTAAGKSYELALVGEPSHLEAASPGATWNSMLNPSAGEPIRLFQVTSSTEGQGFCRPGAVSYLAIARRVEEGGTQVRIAAFDDPTAPSAAAPQTPCSSFVYTEGASGAAPAAAP